MVTFFTLRAPGMSLNRVPILLWGSLSTAVMVIFAMPALTVACVFLYFDRRLACTSSMPSPEGIPALAAPLLDVWAPLGLHRGTSRDGHRVGYPAVFCRRPLVGYTYVVMATIATAILGFGVWVHHMFSTGLPSVAMSFFSAASMVIAIPSGVTVLAWVATIWFGRVVSSTAFLFMAGFVVLFVMGGVSGVMTAAVPFDWQLTDSYFVVAHLHYVLVGINVFPVIGASYFWAPKMTGRMLSERLGRWNFWVMFVGFNLGFFPMHIAGLLGMPRRIYTYPAGLGWDTVNLVTTIGAYLFAVGVLLFVINLVWSLRRGAKASANPWDSATLEWSVSSPPPPYNFELIPVVRSRHPLWEDRLHPDDPARTELSAGSPLAEGRLTLQTSALDAEPAEVLPMPEDSLWPLALALSLTGCFTGLLVANPILAGLSATLPCRAR
jgi:cytochrome c oxidase subunit 1/cytochrome c oxidase subunit I+III